MKTVIVGGGRGCLAILELLDAGHLQELKMEAVCVVDPRPDAPGVVYAREHGRQTMTDYGTALAIPGLELVLELTGDKAILAHIYHMIRPGVRVIDHVSARVFWDLIALEESLRDELKRRAELEEKLAADRKRAQDILDSLPDIVIVLDPHKKVLQANALFSEACSVPLEDAIGQGCDEVLCTTSDEFPNQGRGCPFDRAVADGKPFATIVERHTPEHAFYEVTACPQYDVDGNLVEVVETHHPVTKRVLLRREVEVAMQRFHQFIDSAHDIISIKDREGRYLVVNPSSAALFNMEPLQLIGKTAAEMYDPEVAATIISHDRDVMERKEYTTYTESYNLGGKEYYLETTRFPLFDYEGNVDGVCTIARDVTEKHQLQKQLLQSAKLAAVGKLAAGVAHEINNPLTGVLAYAESLLEETDIDDERREDYEVIIRETLRCRNIVRNLLDFSRQEEPNFQIVDLNDVIGKTLALVERQAKFHDIELIKRIAGEPLRVNADARQLQQILLNLIINARDAMQCRGTITLSSGHRDDGNRCYVSVQDSGPGVPEDVREKIFEPFYSTKSTSGLGLAVSWGIMEQHNGTIEIGDSPAGGADFQVVLPVAQDEAGPLAGKGSSRKG